MGNEYSNTQKWSRPKFDFDLSTTDSQKYLQHQDNPTRNDLPCHLMNQARELRCSVVVVHRTPPSPHDNNTHYASEVPYLEFGIQLSRSSGLEHGGEKMGYTWKVRLTRTGTWQHLDPHVGDPANDDSNSNAMLAWV